MNTDSNEDTELLIALTTSSLKHPPADPTIVLDALVQCNGNAAAAADLLNQRTSRNSKTPISTSKKRKRDVDLDDWLNPTSTKHTSPSKVHNEKALEDSSSTVSLVTRRERQDGGKKPSSSSKPPVDLMSLLRPSVDSQKAPSIPRPPPLNLSTQELVALHTPCTLHLSVLPPELAIKLFYTMVDASRQWQRNRWWLFERMVESPHRTAFFVRKDLDDDYGGEAARFWYNGRTTDPPPTFPPVMEEACHIIEKVVNEEMYRRRGYPLEWRPPSIPIGPDKREGGHARPKQLIWRANVAASNCYEGSKENVGWHSDQLTYLGPYPTIASLSLGTRRIFSLREVVPTNEADIRRPRTYNVALPHNSLIIMHASTQERFKHCIPPQNTIDLYRPLFPHPETGAVDPSNIRINITFRFYRPDFRPESIPKCNCGVPTILRPDMKNTIKTKQEAILQGKKHDDKTDADQGQCKYWWTCYAHAQNDGKGCGYWKVMDMTAEGRGWREEA